MEHVAFPLGPRTSGLQLGHLQSVLLRLLDASIVRPETDDDGSNLRLERSQGIFGPATRGLVSRFQREHGLTVTGIVDEPTADALTAATTALPDISGLVMGSVRFESGLPAVGVTVTAVDRNLRDERPLRETTTVDGGSFLLEYPVQDTVEGGRVDLLVRAFDANGTLLAASPVLFNAPPQVQIDLTIPSGRFAPASLFTRVGTTLEPLLRDVAVEELDETAEHDDLTFLAGKTGFDKRVVARFALAHRLARGWGLPPEFWFAVLGDTLMPLGDGPSLAEDITRVWARLGALDDASLTRSVEAAVAAGDIDRAARKTIPAWIEGFRRLAAGRLLDDGEAPSFVKPVLEQAGVSDADAQLRFARLLLQHGSLTPDLVTDLENDRDFGPARVAQLTVAFALGRMAGSSFPLVAAIRETFGVERLEQIPALARVAETTWSEWAQRIDPDVLDVPIDLGELAGPLQALKPAVYARRLRDRLQATFPTQAFAGDLQRAADSGAAVGLRQPGRLLELVDAYPEFDLLHTRIDGFAGLPDDQEFTRELKAVQRVFKLAPTFLATNALLADGLHSAQRVYRLGENRFARRYVELTGGSPDEARVLWRRAADTHAAVLTMIGDLVGLRDEQQPLALRRDTGALAAFPNWQALFVDGDLCECDRCRSVVGPGAYFADILLFLQGRAALAGSAADVLLGRRPDLGWLELGCENANTTLPYIDLVCEVLEAAVAAGDGDVQLIGLTSIPAPPWDQVREALSATEPPLDPGAEFQLTPIDADRWVVHGTDRTLLLEKKQVPDFYAQVLPNTKAEAAQLRARPAYVNAAAYHRLAGASIPFSLPFDLPGEQVRAGLTACGIARWELMETVRGRSPVNPTDEDLAAEYLGISGTEAALICDARPDQADQEAIWGIPLADLQNVKVFLERTGLDYQQLLALLDLSFVNPGAVLSIEHLDATCDLAAKRITGADAATVAKAFDRIHRFLRLWHKLAGWQLWELDLALHTTGTKLDATFLIDLHDLGRLRARLGDDTTVEQLCGLFGDLNAGTHFIRPYEKRGDGLYQRLFFDPSQGRALDPAFDPATIPASGPTAETIRGHRAVVQAALGVTEQDLERLIASTRVPDRLTRAHLSRLWRHAWLARKLGLTVADWQTVLNLLRRRVRIFAHPANAVQFLRRADTLLATGFTPDQLNWLLTADRSAAAAVDEADTTRFLTGLRADIAATRAPFDPAQHDSADPARLASDLTDLLRQLHRDDAAARFVIDVLRGEARMSRAGVSLLANHQFPVLAGISLSYDPPTSTLSLTGILSPQQRDSLLTDHTLDPSYQDAITDFFERPRLAIGWMDPVFTAPLDVLPAEVVPQPPLSYDAEQRTLNVVGVLTQQDVQALQALSADVAFRAAVRSLFEQPRATASTPDRRWLDPADLATPLTESENIVTNLRNAVAGALAYLAKRSVEDLVVQRTAAQLGLTDGLARHLLTAYRLPADTLMAELTAGTPPGPDGWYWAQRVATLWKQWKLALPQWRLLQALVAPAHLLDVAQLYPNAAVAVPIDRFLATSRLIAFQHSVPELHITFLELLNRLHNGGYGSVADFAADVERLDPRWAADDVAALVGTLSLHYPAAYLQAGAWERLRRAFGFAGRLHVGAASTSSFAAATISFAAATMTETHAAALDQLLSTTLGDDDWLALCTEIQDRLRERKRDALIAYLLAQPAPADAPTGRWANANDLYAYYLLDVEMSSCQLTSRLVQGSASVQLFAQRCLLGVEPEVHPQDDGTGVDSDWRWWSWMSKFRVWQANREVFLWPENWIEPELNRDRSTFMKELESELMQGAVDAPAVETAYANYLTKLDGVAQLEPAGFYQDDDAETPTLHVFGRTKGAQPHLYYHRRFDYHSWTPWEKIDLDISGDYLIPAVIAERLCLFWPVFIDVPADGVPTVMRMPNPGDDVTLTTTAKVRRIHLAMSELRQGSWTPKVMSAEYIQTEQFTGTARFDGYTFFAADRGLPGQPFQIICGGAGDDPAGTTARIPNSPSTPSAFTVAGCHGVPETAPPAVSVASVIVPEGVIMRSLDWEEVPSVPASGSPGLLGIGDDFTLHDWFLDVVPLADVNQPADTSLSVINLAANRTTYLAATPGTFVVAPPRQLSYFDQLLSGGHAHPLQPLAAGLWLPFFYHDDSRSYVVLPDFPGKVPRTDPKAPKSSAFGIDWENTDGPLHRYYPAIAQHTRDDRKSTKDGYQEKVDACLAALDGAELQELDAWLALTDAVEPGWAPPFSNDQRRYLMTAKYMHGADWQLGTRTVRWFQKRRLEFRTFYHPFACHFAKIVEDPQQGIPALMQRETQLNDTGFSFHLDYGPTQTVTDPGTENYYPHEDVDFTPDGAYSSYNWELFFHVPLFIANTLSRNQRFEDAHHWYHFIFNPLAVGDPAPDAPPTSRFWITKPFYETTTDTYVKQRIDTILRILGGDTTAPGYDQQTLPALIAQVRDWRNHPFEPHRIAAHRTVAYQKTVLMKYLDNLIAWADHLFSQDSLESINEATQLYVLAAELLGPPPATVPPRARPPQLTFNELKLDPERFGEVTVDAENLIPALPGDPSPAGAPPLPSLFFCIPPNFFCIPPNEKLLGYWDIVADRLYKIRHCMNIEGVVRQLALFEPQLDPGALVKSIAQGSDVGAAINDLQAPPSLYRFPVLLRAANELCADLKTLGAALLTALDRVDSEELSRIRQTHEINLLDANTAIHQSHVDEAAANLESLERSRDLALIKLNYYSSRPFMNPSENLALQQARLSAGAAVAIPIGHTLASTMRLVPEVSMGWAGYGGSPQLSASGGGSTLAAIINDATQVVADSEHLLDKGAAIASTIASYDRRMDDWTHQQELAAKEIEQLDQSINAAQQRLTATQKELDAHLLQIANARAVDQFMRTKYTAEELYQWHVGQVSGIYFQTYQLAYDLARQAERGYRFELGIADSGYIRFGYWDSLKKGLLAGEHLQHDLRRLETAYREQDRREFELTKHVSLRMLDPEALVKLRETGRCFFAIPEEIFDLDYPGHYFRRIKSVSLTIPCVAGPYTTISCTLRLLRNSIRVSTRRPDSYARGGDDDRFTENTVAVNAIATSGGQSDPGVFELRFRDERYLPFEGAGAVSSWALELFHDAGSKDFGQRLRQFDYQTVSDAVLHLKYTAREDAGNLKAGAVAHLSTYLAANDPAPTAILLDWRRDQPTRWDQFLHPAQPAEGNVFVLDVTPSLFPWRDRDRLITVEKIQVLARCEKAGDYRVELTHPDDAATLVRQKVYRDLHVGELTVPRTVDPTAERQTWNFRIEGPDAADLSPQEVAEVVMIVRYTRAVEIRQVPH